MAETKGSALWLECLKSEKSSPTVAEMIELWRRSLTDLKSTKTGEEKADLERNIDVAILFIQKLYRTGVAFPAPRYNRSADGVIRFVWNPFKGIDSALGLVIVHVNDIPAIGLFCLIIGQNDIEGKLAFNTDQEQDKTVKEIVGILSC
jgi:hypothetical protein